ncbi:hypothetical protein POX_f07560 [Penicillium oxalicum]|uniref:hypothetical protein n=1 Tax=Penicillium oxalicum TaxID=69781 RepID=UPI0020B7158C|nr:hypothetical protein POX_f07560 [Penicillium oxalicum]KAI2787197.1 hypothetical protein POX_f07560 [Penicillium oxalicum]
MDDSTALGWDHTMCKSYRSDAEADADRWIFVAGPGCASAGSMRIIFDQCAHFAWKLPRGLDWMIGRMGDYL